MSHTENLLIFYGNIDVCFISVVILNDLASTRFCPEIQGKLNYLTQTRVIFSHGFPFLSFN